MSTKIITIPIRYRPQKLSFFTLIFGGRYNGVYVVERVLPPLYSLLQCIPNNPFIIKHGQNAEDRVQDSI